MAAIGSPSTDAGHNLELWQTRDGTWLVVDRADLEGEVINGDQLRDLQPMPITTKTPPAIGDHGRDTKLPGVASDQLDALGGLCRGRSEWCRQDHLANAFEFLRNAYLAALPVRSITSEACMVCGPGECQKRNRFSWRFTVGDLRWELQLTAQGPTLSERLGERVTRGDEIVLSRAALSQRLVYRGDERPIAEREERLGIRIAADADNPEELGRSFWPLTSARVYRSYNLWGLQMNGSRQSGDLYLHPSRAECVLCLAELA